VLVLACPDKFRGTLSAAEAAEAIASAVESLGGRCVRRPLADGGEGTLDALGGANRVDDVTGPLGDTVHAPWRFEEGAAVIEAAQACGLVLAGGSQRNDPMRAATRGVGELVVAAVRTGVRRILLGVGGSASTDGGAGAVEAIRDAGVDLDAVELTVCCDVRTPFTAAAEGFAPQKGADERQVAELTRRLRRMRDEVLAESGVDLDAVPGSGAAGGLAGGLVTVGARLVPGFDAIADHVGLEAYIRRADLVVTGEGRLDRTSLDGKVVGGVLGRTRTAGRRTLIVCGTAEVDPGVAVLDLVERFGRSRAWSDAAACVTTAVSDALRQGAAGAGC
jgi:glycerate 2-kinase